MKIENEDDIVGHMLLDMRAGGQPLVTTPVSYRIWKSCKTAMALEKSTMTVPLSDDSRAGLTLVTVCAADVYALRLVAVEGLEIS